jgi:hypothetical protein
MLTETDKKPEALPRQVSRLSRMLKVAWLGQTVASLAWITSVFSYGISQTGDWLQLVAACSWLIANIAAIAGPEAADTAP